MKMTKKKTVWLVCLLTFALCAISWCCVLSAYGEDGADGDGDGDQTTVPAQFTVNLKKSGDTSGIATLDKDVYIEGDDAILTWKGVVSGNNLVIPTAIRYNNTSLSVTQIIEPDSFQTINSEYKRKMKQEVLCVEFNNLKNYITAGHKLSIPNVTADTTITVEFTKVAPVYRLYNSVSSEHLYTTNKTEYDGWVAKCKKNQDFWIGEGINWLAPTSSTGTKTVHRLYNAGLGALGGSSHYYSADTSEINSLVKKSGWKDEGASYQFKSGGSQAIYTCYNEALGSAHLYTASKTEWESLANHGWTLEFKKNTPNGVFQGICATTWSYSGNYYTVNHQLQNADGTYTTVESELVSGKAGSNTAASAKTYPGYTFASMEQKSIAKDNKTAVSVKYDLNSYNVTFDSNGRGTDVEGTTAKYTTKVQKPEDPTEHGYTFENWYWDSECTRLYDFNTPMSPNDLTLYANWTPNTYTIDFDANTGGGAMSSQVLTYDDDQGKIKKCDFVKPGYEFTGWNTKATGDGESYDDEAVMPNVAGDGNVTLYAQWERITYTVSFDSNDGEGSVSPITPIEYDKDFSLPVQLGTATEKFTKVGYTFGGWSFVKGGSARLADGETVRNLSEVNGDTVVLYAVWTPNTYDVVFKSGNAAATGNVATLKDVKYGENIILPDQSEFANSNKFEYTGYKFVGWSLSEAGEKVYDNTETVKNLTTGAEGFESIDLYALWEPVQFTVRFMPNGASSGSVTDMPVKYSDTITLPTISDDKTEETFIRYGYHCTGWSLTDTSDATAKYTNPATFSASELSSVEGSVVKLYCFWTKNTYTVNFDPNVPANCTSKVNPSSVASQTLTFDNKTEKLKTNDFLLEGYNFVGWNTAADKTGTSYADEAVCPNVIDKGEITLYAVWEASRYLLAYEGNGADKGSYSPSYYTYDNDGYVVKDGSALSREGYTFDHWCTDASDTGKKYYYDSSDGAVNKAPNVVSDGSTATLYAIWKANTNTRYEVYHYKQDMQGTYSTVPVITTQSGTSDTLTDANPETYEGYENLAIENVNIDRFGKTIVKIYYKRLVHTLSFSGNWPPNDDVASHGELPDSQEVVYEGLAFEPVTPTCKGYKFDGWYTIKDDDGVADGTIWDDYKWSFTRNTMPNNDVTLFAKWSPISYRITFNSNSEVMGTTPTSGTMTDQQTTVFQGEEVKIVYDLRVQLKKNAWTYTGYTFAGWALTPKGEKKYDDEQDTLYNECSEDGDVLTLYALWAPNKYTINFNSAFTTDSWAGDVKTIDSKSNLNYNDEVLLPDQSINAKDGKFVRRGYIFQGWATSEANAKAGTVKYTNLQKVSGKDFTIPADGQVTLYAVWKVNTYNVVFNPNGCGAVNWKGETYEAATTSKVMGTKSLSYDTALPTNTLACKYYNFNGWNTQPDGSGTQYNDGQSAVNLTGEDGATVILYAQWTAK